MKKIICNECGTENEQQFIYCKNCGNQLKKEEKTEDTKYSQPNNVNPQICYLEYEDIGGVSSEELALFVGKNQNEIMPKFLKMEMSKSKISWCWPAAVLGFFFGPLGSALWFFYRKMYKPALIFSAVGAIISIIIGILSYNTNAEAIENLINSFSTSNLNEILNSLENFTPEETLLTVLTSSIENIASFASAIIGGLFGFYIYKNHSILKIKNFKAIQTDPKYYRFGLTAIGGVSGGMLALGIIIMLGVDYIVSFVTSIIAIFF